VFAQVALTFALLILMGRERYSAIRGGSVDLGEYRRTGSGWPERAARLNNCFKNQFEVPVLFFALVPLIVYTRQAGLFFVILAWMFVVSRVVHAAIYVTTNDLRSRATAYLIGVMMLLLMWLIFAVNFFFGGL